MLTDIFDQTFHRILDDDPDDRNVVNPLKKGQVKWGDFEKVSSENVSSLACLHRDM